MKFRPDRQFLSFAIVGAFGYLVDVAIFKLAFAHGAGTLGARMTSFVVAVAVTWILNRTFSFSSPRRVEASRVVEFVRYFSAMIIGGMVNVASSTLLLYVLADRHIDPALPIAFGSIAGMFCNFYTSKKWVFKERK